MTESQFKAMVHVERNMVWTHLIMVRLTYILYDCVCLIPEWQASNEKLANETWSILDSYMLKNFDIPIPEPRRQTHRRNVAIIKSIERALASYLFLKEEAVAFAEMLPTSEPFRPTRIPRRAFIRWRPSTLDNWSA